MNAFVAAQLSRFGIAGRETPYGDLILFEAATGWCHWRKSKRKHRTFRVTAMSTNQAHAHLQFEDWKPISPIEEKDAKE